MSKHKNRGYQVGATIIASPTPASPQPVEMPQLAYADVSALKPDNPEPYYCEEKSFTTRMGGPDAATLMGEYINRYAIGTGATLLMVHPIPANNSFLFIWENP